MGVINWKELADQATTDALLAEVDAALNAAPAAVATPVKPDAESALPAWVDGPPDLDSIFAPASDVLDFARFGDLPFPNAALPDAPLPGAALPRPHYGADAGVPDAAAFPSPGDEEPRDLAGWLASARALAQAAHGSEDRTRAALYAAVGRAWDFALAAQAAPAEFASLVEGAGLTIQERAPFTPVVKLVFGGDYDKTRLTEYATALAHAHRLALTRGTLADHLATIPGGLKGVVQEERRIKRSGSSAIVRTRSAPRESLARKLRRIAPRPLEAFGQSGGEFTVLLARRLEGGEVVLLGEAEDDVALLERMARRVLG